METLPIMLDIIPKFLIKSLHFSYNFLCIFILKFKWMCYKMEKNSKQKNLSREEEKSEE